MTCRICLEPNDLISVCNCDGTSKWVHEECIKKWVSIRRRDTCEICNAKYTLPSLILDQDTPPNKKCMCLTLCLTFLAAGGHAFQLWFGAETFINEPAPAAVGAIIFTLCQTFLWCINPKYMQYVAAEWLIVFLTVFLSLYMYRPMVPRRGMHILGFVISTNVVVSLIGIICGFRDQCI